MLEAFTLASQGQTAGLIPPGSTTFHLLLAIHMAWSFSWSFRPP
jgi:hypothetical protein